MRIHLNLKSLFIFPFILIGCHNVSEDIPINRIINEVFQKSLNDECSKEISQNRKNIITVANEFYKTIDNSVETLYENAKFSDLVEQKEIHLEKYKNIEIEFSSISDIIVNGDFSESVHFKLNQDSINYLKGVYFNYPKLIALESGEKIVLVK
jgi:hypothetical protein